MADFGVDTSSYPKAVQPQSALQTAGDIGSLLQRQQALQSGRLGISQQQLDQANQAYGYMTQAINSLGPNPTKKDILNIGQKMSDMKLVPPAMVQAMDARVPDDPKQIPAFIREWRLATANHQEMIAGQVGTPGNIQNGQTVQPTVTSNLTGVPQSAGPPIQVGLPPPTQPTVDNDPTSPTYNQPVLLGPKPPTAAPGAVVAPPPAMSLPVQPSTVTPPKNAAFATPPAAAKDQSQVPTGPVPQFTAGQTQYNTDLDTSTARASALKPALLALQKMKDLRSGPGTESWNNAMAFLKANHIIPTDTKDDPTAQYQEVEKYLSQYLGQTPFRSDAEQAMRSSGSPNVHKQIIEALSNLTRTSIMNDRLAAARPLAFTDAQGNPRSDLQSYPQFRAQFPQTTDQRALGLDLMEPKDRQDLLDEMKKKANTKEGQQFWKSLSMVKKLNLYDVN